jgi:hypothetical protein
MESTSEGTPTWLTAGNLLLRTTDIADRRLSTGTKPFCQKNAWGTWRRILMAEMRRLRMTTWRKRPHTWVRALYRGPAWYWGLQYGAPTMTNNL